MTWLAVFVAGGLGAVCRVAMTGWLPMRGFPWGTLAVNLLGCLVIGALFEVFEDHHIEPQVRIAVVGGFLGGFTTFSAFGLECWGLATDGHWGLAAGYAVASLLLGVLGVALGVGAARALT
ncbi:MAG: hypothetical protein CL908_04970 [Deltaproteobacteria bacterium]|nr:hypothetical protein [Deltaproteobacteria bacterium]